MTAGNRGQSNRAPAKRPQSSVQYGELALLRLEGLELHDIVSRGIPAAAAANALRGFRVIPLADILGVLGVSMKTLQRRMRTTLDSNASDRMLRLLSANEMATKVLGSRDAAERWLCTPAIALERRRPIDLLTSSGGVEMVKTLLTRVEYGVYC